MDKHFLSYIEGIKFIRKCSKNHIELTDHTQEIYQFRSVKSREELKKIIEAQRITDKVFTDLLKLLKPGMSELDIETKIRIMGSENLCELAFTPIVASGKNSATPHHLNSNRKISKNDILLLDFGFRKDGYHSDMTRTLFFGNPDKRLIKSYTDIVDSLEKLEAQNWNNREIRELSELAIDHLSAYGSASFSNFHALGHGVGLEIHEAPGIHIKSPKKLILGNIITLEPSIYFENAYGIRVEDMLHIGEKSTTVLTKSTKKLTILN